MSKHTPGPWTVYEFKTKDTDSGGAETHIMCYANDDGEEGASLANVNRWTYGDDPPTEESAANAHLIAAAPDLLAALRRLVEVNDMSCTPCKADIRAAREAITKAKGGAA
jgi:hypothetical protein